MCEYFEDSEALTTAYEMVIQLKALTTKDLRSPFKDDKEVLALAAQILRI